MPSLSFTEEFKSSGSKLFVSLKSKGDKLRYRIIGDMQYEGKHFAKDGDSWTITKCPRINEGNPCDICEKYFDVMKQITKNTSEDEKKAIKKQADPYKVSLSFYIPVIDRDAEEFKVFQTKLSVRRALEEEAKMGTDIMKKDFITVRTENPGPTYYKTSRVDSSDTPALTEKELQAIEDSKKTNMSELIGGTRDEKMAETTSEINPDDIPF